MDKSRKTAAKISVVKSKKYRIYGIFDFKKKKLLSVDLSLEHIELEYDLGDYDKDNCNVIEFEIFLF